jgi:L-alanine-DL-glutamate epimerase-like enolase superfamily enzyme
MFDAFMGWDATYATDMLRGLEPIEPYWMEEPVPPERLDVFRRLSAGTRIRLASGEHMISFSHSAPCLRRMGCRLALRRQCRRKERDDASAGGGVS